MIKLVIFDLDGTLLNTISDLAIAANYALEKVGFPKRDEKECQSFVGNGVSKLLERALPPQARTPENLEKMKKEFFSFYDAHLWDTTFAYDGILELVKELHNKGILLAVASNKYQSATERLVQHFFKNIPFVSVLGQRENIPTKPNPQIVNDIVKIAKVNSAEVLYVGDSDVDMQTANNAKVKSCAVTWGFRDRDLLKQYHPNYIVDNPLQVLKIL